MESETEDSMAVGYELTIYQLLECSNPMNYYVQNVFFQLSLTIMPAKTHKISGA